VLRMWGRNVRQAVACCVLKRNSFERTVTMRIRRIVSVLIGLAAVSFCGVDSASVFAQGGTGKMPPIQRMPPAPPIQRSLPPRRDAPPEKRPATADIYVVPVTASGSLSITDRLPEALGPFRRNKLETNVSDDTNKDLGALEVLRAEYGKDIMLLLSRFRDAAGANNAMQSLVKKSAGYNTVSRKHIRSRSGQALGEFWLLKSSGREENVFLLVTNGAYLYRVYGDSSEDAQRIFKSLLLE
jgi:hypothetical protein